jgi:hypothetical protein
MAAVGLLYVGGVLFVNAVMLLGKANPRSVGIFNPLVVSCRWWCPYTSSRPPKTRP